jgi:hypothetical protein
VDLTCTAQEQHCASLGLCLGVIVFVVLGGLHLGVGPPAHDDHDLALAHLLEQGDGLLVSQALDRNAVDREDLVA